MTWEEFEKELVSWEKQLREIREFFDAINSDLRAINELKGEENATNQEKR